MRTFEFSDAKSHKFWSIDVKGKSFTVTFGRIGTAGQSQTKSFKDTTTAQAEADKLIREKTKKGYVEKKAPKAPSGEEAAFEVALRENPDDLAGWYAYADYLVERDDPRGEFMQTQIALEDEKRSKEERAALKRKEKALLKAHEREWLGGLAPFALDEEPKDEYYDGLTHLTCTWRRGVLRELVVGRLSYALAQVLASDPAVRFIRDLQISDQFNEYYPEDAPKQPKPRVKKPKGASQRSELFELIGSPLLENVRVFQMGHEVPGDDGWCDCHTYVDGLEHAVAPMKRVEVLNLYCKNYESANLFRLPNLTHLRELRVYHLGGYAHRRRYEYALDVLAANPAFANLTHLLFHPHFAEECIHDDYDRGRSYIPLDQVQALLRSKHLKKLTHLQLRLSDMGDAGIRAIIDSGILKQLVWLDLRHGAVTDEGAKMLAGCPDAKRLERIDLSRNAVSKKGLAALRDAGVNAVANKPLTADELENREYLHEGDSE